MTTLTVYDPAMCCSTGICGPEVDPRLAQFSGDLDWLKNHGVEVKRINLSQEPALFTQNENVKSVLEKSGVEGLPVIIVNDALLSSGQYPARDQLAQMTGLALDSEAGDNDIQTMAPVETVQTQTNTNNCCGGHKSKHKQEKSGDGCCGGHSKNTTSSCC